MSVGGYVGASRIVQSDREAETAKRVQIESVRAQSALGDARAYVAGLGNLLEGEPRGGQREFARLTGGAAGSVGLIDALWVQRVPGAERAAYERRLGRPITRLAGTRFAPAPVAAAYLPATFTTGTREELRRGVDVSDWPGLATAIQNRAGVFAVGASLPGSLGSEPGLYLSQAATFGRGRGSQGVLAVFVPRGWLTAALDQDPREAAISADSRRLEGRLEGETAASSGFDLLGRKWRIDVGETPRTALQTALPWLALAWPPAVALLVFLVGRVIVGRRRAERDVELLAREQAALRRVATLVARDVSPAEVLDAVVVEARALLGTDAMRLLRYEGDDIAVVVANNSGPDAEIPVGSRVPLDGDNIPAIVLRTSRPARQQGLQDATGPLAARARALGIEVAVGAPVTVEGRLWGVMVAGWRRQLSLSAETESRMEQFTELVATAIANAESRAGLARLADEQAALRRVATLVAEGASPTAVFDAVAAQMEGLLDADGVTLSRYEADGEITVVAHRGPDAWRVPPGTRVAHEGENVTTMVRRSEQPARMEHYGGTQGAIAEFVEQLAVRASVGAPIVVDGRLWGVVIANWRRELSPPTDTEERMAQFAQLLDTAIANADSHDQLTASRARLLTEGDDARRRVVRDLHDGAQQRLVHTVITLKLAQRALREPDGTAESLVSEALEHAQQGNVELRELAHGILPSVLAYSGLRAGVAAFVERLDLPVQVDVAAGRFPAEIEASAYFIVAEALTNVVKHARAKQATVTARTEDGTLRVQVRDDGIGGARPDGSGLLGLADRLAVLDGQLRVESPPDGGTLVAADIPIPDY
jgi:signal transduction histidine kinase